MNAATKTFGREILVVLLCLGVSAVFSQEQVPKGPTMPLASARSGGAKAEMPITAAGPGFVVEPQAITTTTLYYFPDGENQLKQSPVLGGSTGTVVHAKLFPPRGRTLQSIQAVRVLKATDDRGREIVSAQPATESEDVFSSAGSPQRNLTQIQLHLPLPRADA